MSDWRVSCLPKLVVDPLRICEMRQNKSRLVKRRRRGSKNGGSWELNPGPLVPKTSIILLDHTRVTVRFEITQD
jgi:hypothetical protein